MHINHIYQKILGLLILLFSFSSLAEEKKMLFAANDQLMKLELSELFDIEIVSATKKKQTASETPAAISVITADDMKRAGILHIAEALRMASGMWVAQRNGYDWHVAARGSFNGSFVNKLLVLIDGRSVYNPQLATTYWNSLNIYLDEVARIEVIRGSGGAVWGANAVNGVINIITKSSHETQENSIKIGKGRLTAHNIAIRHGGKLNSNTSYRFNAQLQQNNKTTSSFPADNSRVEKMGFRIDTDINTKMRAYFQGGVSNHQLEDISLSTHAPITTKIRNHFLSSRWEYDRSTTEKIMFKADYSYEQRNVSLFSYQNYILDTELTHQLNNIGKHNIIWGIGYRGIYSEVDANSSIKRDKAERYDQLFSTFIQDDIALNDTTHLILGAKLEHNDYTGAEFQPSIRLAWTPKPHQTLWTALSRSIHTPSQVYDHIKGNMNIPTAFNPFYPLQFDLDIQGNSNLKAESITTYEIGFRTPIAKNFMWDTSFFYNDYDKLTIIESLPHLDAAAGKATLYNIYSNNMDGYTFGVESSLQWRKKAWHIRLNYSYLKIIMHTNPNLMTSYEDVEDENPEHQASFYASVDITPNIQASMNMRYISALPKKNISSITNMDVHFAWQLNKNVSLSLIGKNLLHQQKTEYHQSLFNPFVTPIPRSIYTQLQWQF